MKDPFQTPVPRGWKQISVREAGSIQLGRQRAPKHHAGANMRPYLRVANVFEARIDTRSVYEMNFTPQEFEIYKLSVGDILLNEGQSKELVGRPAIYKGEVPGACFTNSLIRFKPIGEISPEWVLLSFRLYMHSGVFQNIARWTTNIAHLSANRLGDLPFRVPPRCEQAELTAEVDTQESRIDAGVAALKRVQANLKRYRASVLKAACEGRLVPTEADLARRESRDYEPASALLQRILKERRHHWEASELAKLKAKGKSPTDDRWKAKYKTPESADTTGLPELPIGWCWATLEQLSWDSGYGTSAKCEAEAEGAPVLRIPNLVDGAIDLAKLKFSLTPLTDSHEALAPGDFLVVRTNGSKDLIGKGGLVMNQFPRLHFFASYLIRFRLVPVETLSSWVAAYWRSPDARSQVIANAATSAGQYNVSLTELSRIVVPLPPQSEQKRILTEFERLFGIANRLGDAAATDGLRAERLRQSILRSAFEGKLTSPPAVLSAGKPTPNPPPPRTGGTTAAELSHA